MLKGSFTNLHSIKLSNPLSATGNKSLFLLQDSIPPTQTNPQIQQKVRLKTPILQIQADSASQTHHLSTADSILTLSDQREKQAQQPQTRKPAEQVTVLPCDTMANARNEYNYPFSEPQPVSFNAPKDIFAMPAGKVADSHMAQENQQQTTVAVSPVSGFEGTPKNESSISWLPGILLLGLFLFSWIKYAYNKYLLQIVGSTVNYQVSGRLFRERNALMRNMSAGLNFIFVVNAGLLVLFIFNYFHVGQINHNLFVSLFMYSFGIAFIYSVKIFFCKVLGYIFMVREEFAEYVHNVSLFNKNIGLFLFPVIILYPYVDHSLKPVVIYAGISLYIIMILLRSLRSFQIIIRKGVSIFYLILYLCAVEILPVLLLIKLSSTMI